MEKEKAKFIRVSPAVHDRFTKLVARQSEKKGYPVKHSPMVDDLINLWEQKQ